MPKKITVWVVKGVKTRQTKHIFGCYNIKYGLFLPENFRKLAESCVKLQLTNKYL